MRVCVERINHETVRLTIEHVQICIRILVDWDFFFVLLGEDCSLSLSSMQVVKNLN